MASISLSSKAATEEEIEESIVRGLSWLAAQQNPDGSWGTNPGHITALTGFALIKLQMRAHELGYESPFDPGYEYSRNVLAGWVFIFNVTNDIPSYVTAQNISSQTHDGRDDDPDFNGNGIGTYFHNPNIFYTVYATGICLMALEASRTPDRVNDGGIDFDSDGTPTHLQGDSPGRSRMARVRPGRLRQRRGRLGLRGPGQPDGERKHRQLQRGLRRPGPGRRRGLHLHRPRLGQNGA